MCINRELPVPSLLDAAHQLANSGNWEGARVSFQHAVAQLQQSMDEESDHGPSDHGPRKSLEGYELAAALADLAHCCTRLNLHQEAATHCEKSLELKRGYYNFEDDDCCCVISNKNLDLARALEASGNALVECGAYAAAQRRFNEALDMKRLVYGKLQQQHNLQPQHYSNNTSFRRGDARDGSASPTSTTTTPGTHSFPTETHPGGPALQHMKQQVYGYDRAQNSDVASTLTKLGELASIQGRYHTARKRYTEALDMLRAARGGDEGGGSSEFQVDIAKVLALLGQCNAQAGKRHYAAAYLDQAVSVMQAVMATTASPYGSEERQNHEEILRQICGTRDACLADGGCGGGSADAKLHQQQQPQQCAS